MKRLLLPLLLIPLLLASCIKDDLDDCVLNVYFDYSYNMQKTNVFGGQVDEVLLFVFDADGNFVKKFYDKGAQVQKDNYAIKYANLPTGEYQFVAWAQSNHYTHDEAYFDWSNLKKENPSLSDMQAFLRINEANATFKSDLNNLLVGHLPTRTLRSGSTSITMPVKKVNNNVRVVLVNEDIEDLATSDLSFRLEHTTGNGTVKHDFSTTPSGAMTYLPFYYEKVIPRNGTLAPADERTTLQAVAAEFALAKLNEEDVIHLIIENKEGDVIFNKNLIDLIYLLKENGHVPRQMELQEYLDREDHYAITIHATGDKSTWLSTFIIINGWKINLIDIEL